MITSPPLPGQEELASDPDDDEDVKGLEPSGLAIEDAAYYEDEEDNEDLVDLGIAMGKLRITERIGGFVRPRFNEEVRRLVYRKYAETDFYNSLAKRLKSCLRQMTRVSTHSCPSRRMFGWALGRSMWHLRRASSSLQGRRRSPS
jgi:hypothetical protein